MSYPSAYPDWFRALVITVAIAIMVAMVIYGFYGLVLLIQSL